MGAITFDDVSKQFPNAPYPAVDGCSFDVPEGGFVVLLGPSGCGKTTLLKMVNRLYEPSSGAIYLNGENINGIDAVSLRRRIGYVIQQVGLFPHMTVSQNIAVVPDLLGWPDWRIHERADELLTLVDLPPDEYRDRYPSQLSGGQLQRVGVARALAGDPAVILMDEPFGAIDAITRTGLQDELLKLQRTLHKTILFVTHDVEEALHLADKIVVMHRGRVVQYDSPLAVLSRPANDFVYELVGAGDMVRQLGLVRVETAMKPLPAAVRPDGQPAVERTASLREALSLLLRHAQEQVVVTEDGAPIGLLSLADIQASSAGDRSTG